MPTVLITGASRGLGLEFARQYAADGWRVIACCRNPDAATAAKGIAGDVTVRALDVTDAGEVAALAALLDGVAIDLLINNAGVYGPKPCELGDIDIEAWKAAMDVNLYAPFRISRALLNNVAAAKGTIAAMSSVMGSIGTNTSGDSFIYRSSKAALNAVMRTLANEIAPLGVPVVMLHPGWARTDMGGKTAPVDPVASVAALRAIIADTTIATTGRFMSYDGTEIPW